MDNSHSFSARLGFAILLLSFALSLTLVQAEVEEEPALDTPAKVQALNMTQLERQFLEGRKEAHETVASWHRLSKKVKKSIGGIIGSLVPLALNMTQEAKIGSNCSGAMLKWVLSMNQLKSWALRMLDASGKPIAGLLEGSLTMFGNYRECLGVRAPDDDEIELSGKYSEYFRGKYCVIEAKPWLPEKSDFYNLNTKLAGLVESDLVESDLSDGEDSTTAPPTTTTESNFEPEATNPNYDKSIFDELSDWFLAFNFVSIRYDICVPSLCSREDMQKAINYLMRDVEMKARVLRCEQQAPPGARQLGMAALVEASEEEGAGALQVAPSMERLGLFSKLPSPLLGWSLVPLTAILIVLLATAISVALEKRSSASTSGERKRQSKFGHAVKSLSLHRSLGNHLKVDYDQLADDKPLALYGMRFILILWVMLVESAVNLKFEYLRELMSLKDLIFWWPMQIVINSTLQFDSIILLTAFTMSYKNCLNSCANDLKSLSRFVLDKYVRLMPSIMVIAAIVIFMPLAYRGPVWNDYVLKQSSVCQQTGWLNSVFLQNYLPYKQICLPQTWLVCVELQLVLLTAPILYFLNRAYTKRLEEASSNTKIDERDEQIGKSPRRALFWLSTFPGLLLLGCIALGLGVSFYNVYTNQLPPSWFYTMADPDSKALYFGSHMMRIWTHLAVFALGLLAGLECRRMARFAKSASEQRHQIYASHFDAFASKQLQMNKWQQLLQGATSMPTIAAAGFQGQYSNGAFNKGSQFDLASSSISLNMGRSNTTNDLDQFREDQNAPSALNQLGRVAALSIDSNSSSAVSISAGQGSYSRLTRGEPPKKHLCRFLGRILGCFLAAATMAVLIFSTHQWSLSELPTPLASALYDAGSRLAWSLAFIWLLYMVSVPNEAHLNPLQLVTNRQREQQQRSNGFTKEQFGMLARALGHPAMVFLGKLSFLIYLIHPFVHTTVLAIQEQPIYSSWLMLFHILIGNITITVILSTLLSIFVELPIRNLFRRCGTSMALAGTAPATTTTTIGNTSTTDSSATALRSSVSPADFLGSSGSLAQINNSRRRSGPASGSSDQQTGPNAARFQSLNSVA